MKKILNTLYVTTPDAYLSLDGENVVVIKDNNVLGRIPLHNLQGIIGFGYTGASPALIGKCVEYGIELSFLSMYGRFLGRVTGEVNGNVLLRKAQYRISDDKEKRFTIAQNFILGKLYNTRWIIERTCRDYAMRVDVETLKRTSYHLLNSIQKVRVCNDAETLRGIEGEAAQMYFGVFNQMILQQKSEFVFDKRTKRPPLDAVNAMLSFLYTLLAHEAAWALSAVGLDPYVGFLHTDRPGRISLGLDLMEEFRSIMVDRFVITLINKRQVKPDDFIQKENGAVVFREEARKNILAAWQKKKQEMITHPFTGDKVNWGMTIYGQAQLLARYIRGDMDAYPPFLWK